MDEDIELTPTAEFERIISQLSPEDAKIMRRQREDLLFQARRAATAAIMARNLSHGIGKSFISIQP